MFAKEERQPSMKGLSQVTEANLRGATLSLQALVDSVRERDETIKALKENAVISHDERMRLKSELSSIASERDRLARELADLKSLYEEHHVRTLKLVQFVETKCAEIIDQDRRVEGFFLQQDAQRRLGTAPLRPSERVREFRSRFEERQPTKAIPDETSRSSGYFDHTASHFE